MSIKGIFGGEAVYKKIYEHRRQRSPRRSAGAPGLNCLVLGGGGREYAIAWRLANCHSVTTIDVVPGNAGLSLFARVLDRKPDDLVWLDEDFPEVDIYHTSPSKFDSDGDGVGDGAEVF